MGRWFEGSVADASAMLLNPSSNTRRYVIGRMVLWMAEYGEAEDNRAQRHRAVRHLVLNELTYESWRTRIVAVPWSRLRRLGEERLVKA
jgi:hypothetical protein